MKMSFWGSAVLSLFILATSCNNETVESIDNQNSQLTFKTVLGKQTRASEFTGTSWVATDNFPIKGYANGDASTTPFFDKVLTYSGSAWSYPAPVVSQPGYVVNYHAWYPTANVTFDPTSNGNVAKMSYTVQVVGSQVDLIAATKSTSTPAVILPFKHILSQVNFAIQGVRSVKVEISNISINGVKDAGVYTFAEAGGSWATLTGSATYAYAPLAGTDKTTGANTDISYLGNHTGSYGNNNALMLMPQNFTAPADGNFSFSFVLKSMADVTLANGSTSANFSDFGINWVMGVRYIYLIDFSSYLIGGPISFTVDVDGWDDAAPTAQTIQVANAQKESIEAAITAHNTADGVTTALAIFPISVPVDPAVIELKDFVSTNFDVDDEIRIKFLSATGISGVTLHSSLTSVWDLSVSGSTVILKKL